MRKSGILKLNTASFLPQISRFLLLLLSLFFFLLFTNNNAFAAICDGGPQCTGTDALSCTAIAGCSWVVDIHQQDETPFTTTICNLLGVATGDGGKAFTAFAIISLGIGFYFGKVSWSIILGVAAGIGSLFGSATIITAVTGGSVVDCMTKVRSGCDAISPGYNIASNATASGIRAAHNGSITISCNAGYIGKITNLTCIDGKWYGGAGICKETSCKDLDTSHPLANGRWRETQAVDNYTIYGDCNQPGFYGSPSIKCVAGEFTNLTGSCLPLPECNQSSPGYKSIFGQWSPMPTIVGQTASATCDAPGANQTIGTPPSNMTCGFDPNDKTKGKWSGGIGSDCRSYLKCNGAAANSDSATKLTYGTWPSGYTNHNTIITATCNQGNISPMPSLICNDGVWIKQNNSVCPQGCTGSSTFKSLTAGHWPKENANHGETIDGVCDFGSSILPRLSCSNNIWTFNGGACKAGCSTSNIKVNNALVIVPNGSFPSTPSIIAHNATLSAICNQGNPSEMPALKCTDGVWAWDSTNKVCPSKCTSASPGFKNLALGGSWPNPTEANSGSFISGNCPSGFSGTAAPRLDCNDGSWSWNNSDCLASCPIANAPVAANATWGTATPISHNVNATATCNTGYQGSITSKCNNGTFEPIVGNCTPKPCNSLTLANGVWKDSGGVTVTSASSGQTLTGACNNGYVANNGTTPTLSCSLGVATTNGSCRALASCTSTSPNFPNINSGIWTQSLVQSGYTNTLSGCSSGYILSGTNRTIGCNDGTWVTTTGYNFNGACNPPVRCSSTSSGFRTLAKGEWLYNGSTYNGSEIISGSYLTARCYGGSSTVSNLVCNNSSGTGVWSGGTGTCPNVYCSGFSVDYTNSHYWTGPVVYPTLLAPDTGMKCYKSNKAPTCNGTRYYDPLSNWGYNKINGCKADGTWYSTGLCIDAREAPGGCSAGWYN